MVVRSNSCQAWAVFRCRSFGLENMRILHVITGLSQGGAERQLANLVSVFPKESAVFSLMAPGVMAEEIRKAGVPVYTGGVRRRTSAVWIPRLCSAFKEVQPDAIMGWMYHGNLAASLSRWFGHRGALLWNVRHSLHDLQMEKLSTRWVIRAGALLGGCPNRVVFNSVTAAEQHELLGYPSHKRVILPNGFDLSRFKPDPDARRAWRDQLKVPEGRFLLGLVGRSHPMKNHLGWLAAYRILVDDGFPVHCVMVGNGIAEPEGPVASSVRRLCLESAVTLLPPTDSPESLYPALDLLVLPSRGEGFPNVVGEAMASGVPALVTDVGDAATVVGDTGFVASDTTAKGLSRAVLEALQQGSAKLIELGQLAQERMNENYSLESVAHRYRVVFENALGG
jgi:glycosyltransferase involved in cell wall biosynthesis